MLKTSMNKISKNEKGFTAVEGLLIILILVVIGAVGYMVYHNDHKNKTTSVTATAVKGSSQKASPTTTSSTTSQATESTNNTARANDAKSLMTAFDNYLDNNEDSPPTIVMAAGNSSAYLCASASCDSTNSSVVNLDFYKPQSISIKFKSLSVPSDSTVYITEGVACVNDKAEAAEDDSINSVVYAIQNGSSITQQCVTD
jgi:Flp pilus assembly pilin Flp